MTEAPAARTTARAANPLRVLRNRNFTRLFAAGIASVSGGTIGEVCLLWLIYNSTHSALYIAFYGVAFLATGVALSLLAGVLVDRYDRRRLMILADLARAASVGVLFVLLYLFGFHFVFILGAVVVIAAFSTLFVPAQNSLLPALVGPGAVADANGMVQSSTAIVSFVSNSAAGLLIATLGPVVGLGYNSLTFLASAALVAAVVVPALSDSEVARRKASPSRSYVGDIREGLRYLRGEVGLLQLTLSAGIGNFFFTMVFAFWVVYATAGLHAGPQVFGLLLALLALGGGVGALMVGRLGAVRYAGVIWAGGAVVQGALILGLAFWPTLASALALGTCLGFSLGFMNTTWLTTAQLIVPTEMQGRYFGIDQVGSLAIIPIAQIVGALVIGARGILFAFGVAGAGLLVVGIGFSFARPLRELGYRGGERPSGPAHPEAAEGGIPPESPKPIRPLDLT